MEEVVEQTSRASGDAITFWVERAATGIEVLAVAIIVLVILVATAQYIGRLLMRRASAEVYTLYRHQVARARMSRDTK
jgi:Tfp pilus assembly protein PilV